MLPSQILLNNLLYDTSQLAIPTDDVDPEQVAQPTRWDMGFIRRFMLFFGPISSVFDFATFGIMLWVFHAGPASVPDRLVRGVPGHPDPGDLRRSAPGGSRSSAAARASPLLLAALGVVTVGAVLPYTGPWPTSWASGPCPASFFLALAGIVVCYLVLIEVGKHWFYRLYRAPATPAPRHRTPATACAAAPPASPSTPCTQPADTTPARASRSGKRAKSRLGELVGGWYHWRDSTCAVGSCAVTTS